MMRPLARTGALERTLAGPLFDMESGPDADKRATIRAGQQAGYLIDLMDGGEILSLVTAMSMTWSLVGAMIAATLKDPRADHDRRRTALCLSGRPRLHSLTPRMRGLRGFVHASPAP